MKTLRTMWLDPVVKDLQDPDNTNFMLLESRLRSAYLKLDSDFSKKAPGCRSLCSNWAYIYKLVGTTFFLIISACPGLQMAGMEMN